MNYAWSAYTAVALVSGTVFFQAHPRLLTESPPPAAKLCRAIDGDTLRCGDDRIRLLGIDAAELPGHCRKGRDCAPGDPHAQHARLNELASGQLTIQPIATDRYGRTIAVVTTAAHVNLSCAMLREGARYVADWDNDYRIARACVADLMKSPPPKKD